MKYNLIAYLGFTVARPNGKPFGTICLLDKKENSFSPEVIELMRKMRDMIEGHLYIENLLIQNAQQTEVLKKSMFSIGLILKRKLFNKICRAERYEEPVSLIMLDLDFFKSVNNTFGHLIGDETLKQASKVMGQIIRS